MKVIPNGIAAEIRSEMAKQRLSVKELSERTAMSYGSAIRKINEESRELTVGELQRIASALSISPAELFRRAELACARGLQSDEPSGKDLV